MSEKTTEHILVEALKRIAEPNYSFEYSGLDSLTVSIKRKQIAISALKELGIDPYLDKDFSKERDEEIKKISEMVENKR